MVIRLVENIGCYNCGYLDSAQKFLDIATLEGQGVLVEYGWNLHNQSERDEIRKKYSGAICPKCGNFSDLELFPEKDLEILVTPFFPQAIN